MCIKTRTFSFSHYLNSLKKTVLMTWIEAKEANESFNHQTLPPETQQARSLRHVEFSDTQCYEIIVKH